MPSPFPGMDPYIERPPIWPDFHDSLITYIKAALQPLLRPRYVALSQDRLYVVESERPIRPDISLVPTSSRSPRRAAGAVAELTPPLVFALDREVVREPLIEILEPSAGNRVVTAIEVLSPDNKTPGAGRDSYLRKREEYWAGGTNLVEIDLLHTGAPTVRLSAERLASVPPRHYLVTVSRCEPPRQEVYPVALRNRLPYFAIPLASVEEDVSLDLQAVFTRCWDEGPYPEILFYNDPPHGKWSAEELAWCDEQLRKAGFRGDPAPIPS